MRARWILVILGLLMMGCSGRAAEAAPAVTVNGFFEQATLQSGALQMGETQELHLLLHNGGGSETIFQLTVTYANGIEQSVINTTLGRETTLSWAIPADAGVGVATFHLTTSDCGCGVRAPGQVNITGEAKGEFRVQ